MPTDHAEVSLTNVQRARLAMLGEEGRASTWRRPSCTRTASARPPRASARRSTASTCRSPTPRTARSSASRSPQPGDPVSAGRAADRGRDDARPVRKTAWHLDRQHHMEVSEWWRCATTAPTGWCCEAADRAIQVHGGIGYSRHMPFEHIYRHHRRYRITEGSEEIQIRRVAQYLFNFSGKRHSG